MNGGEPRLRAVSGSRPEPFEVALGPFRWFARLEASSGIVLLACVIIAMAWVNSPIGHTHHEFFHAHVGIEIDNEIVGLPLIEWIDEALMALFFLLVGLEIKREILIGELRSPRRAALPIIGAIGGMVAPAAIFAVIAGPSMGEHEALGRGWGVPMATDIAFALGAIALLGRRLPGSLRVFLGTLAIVDDIGALLVIAIFYTERIEFGPLGLAGGVLVLLLVAGRLGVRHPFIYLLAGGLLVYLFSQAGVHATIAGVLLAFTIPATGRVDATSYQEATGSAVEVFEDETPKATGAIRLTETQVEALQAIRENTRLVQPPLIRVEHALQPWIVFGVVPLFALANAGVPVSGSMEPGGMAAAAATGVALLVGKPLGIFVACYIGVRAKLATLPTGVSWLHIAGAGLLGGIGFTMAIFIANLAYAGSPALLESAKLGVMASSLLALVLGLATLWVASKRAGTSG